MNSQINSKKNKEKTEFLNADLPKLLMPQLPTEDFLTTCCLNKQWYNLRFTPNSLYLSNNYLKNFDSQRYVQNVTEKIFLSELRRLDLNDFFISNNLLKEILNQSKSLSSLSLTNILGLSEIKISKTIVDLRLNLLKDLKRLYFEDQSQKLEKLEIISCKKLENSESKICISEKLTLSKINFLNDFKTKCLEIKEINLKNSGKIQFPFSTLKNLTKLNLGKCSLKEENFKEIKKLIHLKSIDLWSCNLKENQLNFIIPKFSKLISLNLSCNKEISDQNIIQISKTCQYLKVIHLWWCLNLTDDGILSLKSIQSLEVLNLNWISNLTDKGVLEISKLPNLRILLLSKCTGVTDEGIKELKNLEQIDLSENKNLTDDGLIIFAENNEDSLEQITLLKCSNISDKSISFLVRNTKKLDFLNLNETKVSQDLLKNIFDLELEIKV
eukprot:gene9633-1837_t